MSVTFKELLIDKIDQLRDIIREKDSQWQDLQEDRRRLLAKLDLEKKRCLYLEQKVEELLRITPSTPTTQGMIESYIRKHKEIDNADVHMARQELGE